MSVYEKVILAVDDDRELLKMLDSIFQKAGYRHVLTAERRSCCGRKSSRSF